MIQPFSGCILYHIFKNNCPSTIHSPLEMAHAVSSSNLVGQRCGDGSIYKRNTNKLSDGKIQDLLKMVLDHKYWSTERADNLFRVKYITEYLESKSTCASVDKIPCMHIIPVDAMTQMLANAKPPCVGGGTVDFAKFNDFMCDCDNQLEARFKEFVISGMCNMCQAWYIERDSGF